MSQDHLTKEELKHDAFQDFMWKAVGFAQQHKTRFIAGGVAVVLVVVGIWGAFAWKNHRREQAATAWYELLKKATQAPPGQDQAQRLAGIEKLLGEYLGQYGDTEYGALARINMAQLAMTQKKNDVAKGHLRQLLDMGNTPPAMRVGVATTLGGILEDEGKWDEADQVYAGMPSGFEDIQHYNHIRVAVAKKDRPGALRHLEALEKEKPDSPLLGQARQKARLLPAE